jgi:hypothetical protein
MFRWFFFTAAFGVAAIGTLLASLFMGHGMDRRATAHTHVLVSARDLLVPTPLIRPDTGTHEGHRERLDMVLGWPDVRAVPREGRQRIFMAVAKADTGLDPSERTADIYARFVEAETWSGQGGLVVRRFKANSPYTGEELHLTAPDGRVFAARCPQPGSALDTAFQGCLWMLRQEGLDLQVRFPADLLADWEKLDRDIRGLMRDMTTNAGFRDKR